MKTKGTDCLNLSSPVKVLEDMSPEVYHSSQRGIRIRIRIFCVGSPHEFSKLDFKTAMKVSDGSPLKHAPKDMVAELCAESQDIWILI